MNAEQLLHNFERISEAPDAIKRLRGFILDLAVRGKLVEQDPGDEPATELLKRIGAEKARLVKAGEIRKPKPLPPINKEDIPVAEEIAGWTWIRLGEVSTLVTKGSTPTSYGHAYTSEGINFIKVESIRKGLLRPENITSFISDETNQFLSRSRLARGDILFSIAGSIGTCAVVTEIILPANTNQACAIIRGNQSAFVSEFLLKSLQSSVASSVMEKARGGAMNNVSLEDIKNFVVPLPPLAEQHRIVAKVDELMGLCDQLEAAKAEREQFRDSLVGASLQRLNQPAEEEETFREHARFTFNNLPLITTRATHIKQLRQTILNLAVRGKLAEQDPGDSIKPFPPSLFGLATGCDQIPDTWLYVPLSCLLREDTRNGYSRKPDDAEDGVPILRISAGTARDDGLVAEEEYKLISGIDSVLSSKYQTLPGDLFACRFNGNKAYVGRLTLFTGYLGKQFIYPDKLIRIRLAAEIACPLFLRWISSAVLVRDEIESKCATTVGNWGISAGRLKSCFFPLPPLAEQHRIVAKVDELMAICDQLEAQITEKEQGSRRFLESVLADALAPGIDLSAEAQVA